MTVILSEYTASAVFTTVRLYSMISLIFGVELETVFPGVTGIGSTLNVVELSINL